MHVFVFSELNRLAIIVAHVALFVFGELLAVLVVAPLTLVTQIGSARSTRGLVIDRGKHAGSLLILGAWR